MKHTAIASSAVLATILCSATSMAVSTPSAPTCVIIKRGVLGDIPDAEIYSLYPDHNESTAPEVNTGYSSTVGEKRALFGFDLSAIPAGALVTSANFYALTYSSTAQTVRVHRVLAPWSEGTVTWNNLGGIDPAAFASFVSGGSGWRTIDLTSLVQEWVSGVSPNYGILLEEDVYGKTSYKSSDHLDLSYRPSMEVCYTTLKGSIGNRVWFDADANGIESSTELGIAGVVLDLFGDSDCDGSADGDLLASVATSESGSYRFSDLSAGCYVVSVDDATLPLGHVLTTETEPLAVELEPGEEFNEADFGYVTTSSIGDTVWLDSDADGLYEPSTGELGVNGVQVELFLGSTLIDTTITGDSPYTGQPGFYLFDSLPPGTYTVVITSDNFMTSGPLAGHEPTADFDGGLDSVATVSLALGQDMLDADFGYQLSCGNGVCAEDESCGTCAVDCGVCPPVCGNGTCEAGEDCGSCADDCGACPAVCGNNVCESGEDCTTCAGDCGACPAVCGNDVCEAGEDCLECPSDCGICPPVCGSGVCEVGETCSSCSADCGACPPVCGDGTCDAGREDCASCSADCGACPAAAPGTGTPGYWKNHPNAWPVDRLTIGGTTYTKAQLLDIISRPTKGDVTYIIAKHLVCAKLNVGIGNQSSCIEGTIAAADLWLQQNPLGSNVKDKKEKGKPSPWESGEPLSEQLDAYNNGRLCAPHRD